MKKTSKYYSQLAQKIGGIMIAAGLKGFVAPYAIQRTRAGHWQRALGAWSFVLVDFYDREVVGSQYSATTIVKHYPLPGAYISIEYGKYVIDVELKIT
ncbi:hypothetical protein M0R19_05065 [Candidatus Pacearchaeota archaeon]|jgi:hypothetical protein|nr:hypothetical protein [Candidatus Pacearchaeota archaeon]